jgi:HEAT repeat protein
VNNLQRAGVVLAIALASIPAASVSLAAPAVPGPSYEQKLSWILRLEDQRILRDQPPPAPPVVTDDKKKKKKSKEPEAPPPMVPDLIAMLKDPDARIRRRAALGAGRVRLAEAVAPLSALMASDSEPEVRQMAAFALGLCGRAEAAGALRTALNDQSPLVRGRAAEALGLIGDTASAGAVGQMVQAYVKAGALSTVTADELGYPLAPETEAARLGLYALVRLKAFDPMASAVLDAAGEPVSRWWPIAFALGRVHDPKAIPALRTLVSGEGRYTRGFAARGLGALKDREAFDLLKTLVGDVAREPGPAVEAVRALGEIGDPRAVPVFLGLLRTPGVNPGIRADVAAALGKLRAPAAVDSLLDLISDPAPPVRAQAVKALAASDPQRFLETLSALEPDRQWSVRAAVAEALGSLPVETAAPLLESMAADQDQRVVPAVLGTLTTLKAPRTLAIAYDKLRSPDPVVRAAAARAIGELNPPGAADVLKQAAAYADRDAMYVARVAALSALADLGLPAADGPLTAALADKDWAVRVKAAELLRKLDPSRNLDAKIRPAPSRYDQSTYSSVDVVSPKFSTELFIDTDKGTIQVGLAVLDAPLTARTIIELARSGFFSGVPIHRIVPNFVVQDGDPRGDGEGGPGFTIRDELNERPFLRGTVGMALDWPDTGGSQFFITLSPQPHLDAKYTVIGTVLAGMDVAQKLVQGDTIRGIRVWDGITAMSTPTILKQ